MNTTNIKIHIKFRELCDLLLKSDAETAKEISVELWRRVNHTNNACALLATAMDALREHGDETTLPWLETQIKNKNNE